MGSANSFRHLLAPGRIGALETRNRIVMAPMGSNLAEPNGHAGERIKRYYEERAQGGAGLIIVGVGAITYPAGACIPNQVAISDDAFLPDLQDLTRRIHAAGAKAAIQLQHAGKVATQDIAAGRPMWVPSDLPIKAGDLFDDLTAEEMQSMTSYLARPGAQVAFHEMSAADIRQLVVWFAGAAERAQRAGFDGVEIHAAHGYLMSSFLSPAANQRTDEYGGGLENRARVLVETIRAVRERVGSSIAVWCRLDGTEFRIENGITAADAQRTAELAEKAGADAIHVSAYADPTSGVAFTEAPLVHQPCGYVGLAAGIKKRVRIPVIAAGRIEPHEANEIIQAGKTDFVAMGRKLLADPELPRKLSAGHAGDIRPCIYCYTCVGKIYLNESTCCSVNPAAGKEAEFDIVPAKKPRRIVIAGGGPAGMEAARVAARRGHRVTLYEKSKQLGGAFIFSSLLYEANGKLIEYLERQVRKLPIELRLGQEVTPELVRQLAPDVVLVAVGAGHADPNVTGAERATVLTGDDLRSLLAGDATSTGARKLTTWQRAALGLGRLLSISQRMALARRWMPLGKRVAIIGGGVVGIELAEFLSPRGREISVLEERDKLAVEMALPRRWRALHELRERGVRLLTQVRVEEISDAGVVYRCGAAEPQTLPADSVILATGAGENRHLGDTIAALGMEVHFLGDCAGLGYVQRAIADAARVARRI